VDGAIVLHFKVYDLGKSLSSTRKPSRYNLLRLRAGDRLVLESLVRMKLSPAALTGPSVRLSVQGKMLPPVQVACRSDRFKWLKHRRYDCSHFRHDHPRARFPHGIAIIMTSVFPPTSMEIVPLLYMHHGHISPLYPGWPAIAAYSP
jgi:hypothetical protein